MTIEENAAASELPDDVTAWRNEWAPPFLHAKDSMCRGVYMKAAIAGWRVVENHRTLHPETHAIARQAVVDQLHRWGVIAGFGDDDMQQLVVEAKGVAAAGDGAEVDAEVDSEADSRAPEFSDEAIALKFAERHVDRLRYVAPWRTWLIWSHGRWQVDVKLRAFNLARRICREIARGCENKKAASAIASAKTVAAIERLARADQRLAATTDEWDRDPWLLNTPAGIVDLRTGKLGPHRSDAYMTKITSVAPNASCPIPIWLKFLNRAMNGDKELVAFKQRSFGYSFTGSVREHGLFFCYGTGGNGKDTMVNVLSGIAGDYHRVCPIEVFTATQGDRHPTELAGLRGARIVTATETEEGRRWAETKIKAVTGGGKMTARFMRADFFDFFPQFKLWIAGNHKPGLRSVDEAIRRRFHLIPFAVTIPKEERDQTLGDQLKEEWPGILAWTIEGCLAWQQHGLAPPAAVQTATDEYLEAEDAVGGWHEQAGMRNANAFELSVDLYRSWRNYCDRTGEFAGKLKAFVQRLVDRADAFGMRKGRDGPGRRGFFGFELRKSIPDHDGGDDGGNAKADEVEI